MDTSGKETAETDYRHEFEMLKIQFSFFKFMVKSSVIFILSTAGIILLSKYFQ